jgi:hypothetical protein
MARTGESYSTARMHLLAAHSPDRARLEKVMNLANNRMAELPRENWPADRSAGIISVFVACTSEPGQLRENSYVLSWLEPHKSPGIYGYGQSQALPDAFGYVQGDDRWRAVGRLHTDHGIAEFATNHFTGPMRSIFAHRDGTVPTDQVMVVNHAAHWVRSVAFQGIRALIEAGNRGSYRIFAAILNPQGVRVANHDMDWEGAWRRTLDLQEPGPLRAGPIEVDELAAAKRSTIEVAVQPLLLTLFRMANPSAFALSR